MRCAGVPVMSWPSKRIFPEVGANVPVSRLKRVVFPAPFGPMIECRLPGSTASDTPLTAVNAPKDLVNSRVSRSATRFPACESRPGFDHAAAEEQDDDD